MPMAPSLQSQEQAFWNLGGMPVMLRLHLDRFWDCDPVLSGTAFISQQEH